MRLALQSKLMEGLDEAGCKNEFDRWRNWVRKIICDVHPNPDYNVNYHYGRTRFYRDGE
jgi:hypothetical protein